MDINMNIIISGLQGSGKGTQAKLLANKYNLRHISTGDLIRKHIRNQTEFGISYQNAYNRGELAPDDVIYSMILAEISELKTEYGYILDGFPRNRTQKDWVMSNLDIDYVIVLDTSEENAMNRMVKRNRSDDNLNGMNKRMDTYINETKPAIEFLGVDLNVDANDSVDIIFERITTFIDNNYTEPQSLMNIITLC